MIIQLLHELYVLRHIYRARYGNSGSAIELYMCCIIRLSKSPDLELICLALGILLPHRASEPLLTLLNADGLPSPPASDSMVSTYAFFIRAISRSGAGHALSRSLSVGQTTLAFLCSRRLFVLPPPSLIAFACFFVPSSLR